jgi:hypothetical protein
VVPIAVFSMAATEQKDYLRRLWAVFVRVEREPLPRPAMERLLNHFLETDPLYPGDRAMFRRQVLEASGGNPGLLKSILADAQKQRQVTLAEIRELGRADEADYFNLGPLYVFALIGFTLAKIILHASGPAELYIVLSVFSVVMLMVIRVFRVFFILRPRYSVLYS